MSTHLNTSRNCISCMGDEIISQDSTPLEGTVRRLAEELNISMQDTSGVSYACALEGRKDELMLDYHCDFDGYESFKAVKGSTRFAISKVLGDYVIDIKNSGRSLFNCSLELPETCIEKKINFRLLENDIRSELDKLHEPIVNITEADLAFITSKTVLKYLGNS